MSDTTETSTQTRSVQTTPSETALATATMRALAALDDRAEIRGGDTLAEIFLPPDRALPLKDRAIRQHILQNKTAPGVYEFMIARTAYFDRVVKDALLQSIPQLVFLGAGYDSRPYRFSALTATTKIFELDAAPTQARKREILKQTNIEPPAHLVYAPIDFATDSLNDVLLQAGFVSDERALFVWEGVTYYLSAQAVDATLAAIKAVALPGSSLCFDYATVSPAALRDEGAQKLREHMQSKYAAEPTRFGIPQGTIAAFLAARGYTLLEHLDRADMISQYLTLSDGTIIGQPPALFALVCAQVSG